MHLNVEKKNNIPKKAYYNGYLIITGLIVAIVGSICYAITIEFYYLYHHHCFK